MPKTLYSQFLGLYRVILVKNHPVSVILGNSYPLSWNFNFCRNLTDIEIGLLERLVSFLNSVHFSSFAVDLKAWSLSFSDLFILTYFFLALSNFSNPILFLSANLLCKSKAPSKVKAFAWLVVYRKLNTNDMLQLRRPFKSLKLDRYILCKENGESIDHLFLHNLITLRLGHCLFNQAKID